MLYENDINQLLSKWEAGLDKHSPDYKVAVRDCIYDIKNLMDKQLADEAFEQQLRKDAQYWDKYFDNLLADGMFV